MRDDSAEILFQFFLQEAIAQKCALFDVVHPVFPLPTTASTTLKAALKDGFGEGVRARNMLEPCGFHLFFKIFFFMLATTRMDSSKINSERKGHAERRGVGRLKYEYGNQIASRFVSSQSL